MDNNKDLKMSNKRYCFDPFSMDSLLLEQMLLDNNIKFVKNYVTTRQSSIVYSFFEKDIDFVEAVLSKIEKDSNEYEKKRNKIKVQKSTPEHKIKKIAVSFLIILLIILVLSIW